MLSIMDQFTIDFFILMKNKTFIENKGKITRGKYIFKKKKKKKSLKGQETTKTRERKKKRNKTSKLNKGAPIQKNVRFCV